MRKLKVIKAKIGAGYHSMVLITLNALYKASILSINAVWKPTIKHFLKLLAYYEFLVREGEATPTNELNQKLSEFDDLFKSIGQ